MARRSIGRGLTLGLLTLALAGCVTYHQPRYGVDGVYFDQRHAAPRQVVVVDPVLYPYWSLDFFYFSRFHRPYYSPFFVHDPWFFHDPWRHPRHRWAGTVVWSHPVVYSAPPPDQRLWLMQDRTTVSRPSRQAAWRDPGSEVQLRHRLAEDRAAASRRDAAGLRSQAPPAAGVQRTREPVSRPAQRPASSRQSAPSRQAPAPRSQPRQQGSRDTGSQRPAERPVRQADRPSPASRISPSRERRDEP